MMILGPVQLCIKVTPMPLIMRQPRRHFLQQRNRSEMGSQNHRGLRVLLPRIPMVQTRQYLPEVKRENLPWMEELEVGDRMVHLAVGFQTNDSQMGASALLEMIRVPTLEAALEGPWVGGVPSIEASRSTSLLPFFQKRKACSCSNIIITRSRAQEEQARLYGDTATLCGC